jgi:3-oxoacyl-[acyl-carrier protein] reductase
MNIDLTGKIALVTGGSRGIGKECSLLLSDAGAKVIINYHKSGAKAEEVRKEISQKGRESWIIQADIAQPEEVGRLFEYIKKEFGKLHILVNNAGIIRDNLLLALELRDWDRVHDVNLRGPFLCTKYAVEMMMSNHSGKIINIASTGAIRGGRGQTNYASAKGGLVSFTRACAVELAGKGIQVNAILSENGLERKSLKKYHLPGSVSLLTLQALRYFLPLTGQIILPARPYPLTEVLVSHDTDTSGSRPCRTPEI